MDPVLWRQYMMDFMPGSRIKHENGMMLIGWDSSDAGRRYLISPQAIHCHVPDRSSGGIADGEATLARDTQLRLTERHLLSPEIRRRFERAADLRRGHGGAFHRNINGLP